MTSPIGAIEQLLRDVGFEESALARDFVASTPRGLVNVPLVAFGRPAIRDATSAVVVASDAWNGAPAELLEAARFLAAPIVLTTDGREVAAWPIADGPPRTWRLDGPADRDVLGSLDPQRLLQAKVGTIQLPLFDAPVNLLSRARTLGRSLLFPRIQAALELADEEVRHRSDLADDGSDSPANRRAHQEAARLVVGALATAVFADKDPSRRDLSRDELVASMLDQHEHLLGWLSTANQRDRQLFDAVVDELRSGIDFGGLDPRVLSEVYEDCLVSEALRRRLAIHYTPSWLATRMLSDLPLEVVAPEHRLVYDPTCGSGSLLLAAHDRLVGLADRDVVDSSHRLRLLGQDDDPFAVEISRLALALQATPMGNGWRVRTGDALAIHDLELRPTVVVTNPPWGFSSAGAHNEKADVFVRAAVDLLAPGGLLAIVVPESWLGTATSKDARSHLLERVEVFDVWHVEVGAFSSRMAGAIVMGRRLAPGEQHYGARVSRWVRTGDFQAFGDGRESSHAAFLSGRERPLLSGPISAWLLDLDWRQLQEVATIRSGPQPKAGGAEAYEGDTPWLGSTRLLRPFARVDSDALPRVDFPGGFQTGRGAELIGRPKVLVPESRGGPNPWRLRVAFDATGIATTNTLRGVAALDDEAETLYALLAILGSGLASAYVAERMVGWHIPAPVLSGFPVPPPGKHWGALGEAGREACDAATMDDRRRLTDALRRVEDLVFQAYATPPWLQRTVKDWLGQDPAPEGVHRYEAPERVELAEDDLVGPWRLGWIRSVAPGHVMIDVPSHSREPIELTQAPGMPGWLLRPGETFEVRLHDERPEWSRFRLQAGAWRDNDPQVIVGEMESV